MLFSSEPILSHPDPSRQFVVEVDASDIRVGTILSHPDPADQKLHSCALYSQQLMPAEVNYDVWNRELLAVVLAGVKTLVGVICPIVCSVNRPN